MNTKKVIFPDDLKSLEKDVADMKAKTEIMAKRITKELSEYGLKEMKSIYDSFGYLSFGNEPNTFYIDGTDTEKRVVMEGPQAIYEEFGTGTEGEQNPHPIKKTFDLNEYNSGKTIRKATKKDSDNALLQGKDIPEGGLFWTYRNNVGDKIYTQGTPAQKEGYDSMNKTWKKSKSIIQKISKEVMFNG